MGLYLGLLERSDEVVIGHEDGSVIKARSIKRLPACQRSHAELVKNLKGLPWKPQPNEEGNEIKVLIPSESRVPENELPPVQRIARGPDTVKKQVYIRRDVELAKYGFTPSCAGCNAAQVDAS